MIKISIQNVSVIKQIHAYTTAKCSDSGQQAILSSLAIPFLANGAAIAAPQCRGALAANTAKPCLVKTGEVIKPASELTISGTTRIWHPETAIVIFAHPPEIAV